MGNLFRTTAANLLSIVTHVPLRLGSSWIFKLYERERFFFLRRIRLVAPKIFSEFSSGSKPDPVRKLLIMIQC
ncbi:MAG: hypothetical protein LC117_01890 [Bacteroidia bacterium]|nr:hypothetical protein [Bacteroidia bacterium]MCZ2276666.1 hypothetical protein [Bacteroidia bacterium]